MTEDQLLAAVLDLATMYDWKVFHVTNSTRLVRKGQGFIRVKNINPQGNGFPDLVMVRRGRLIFAELKQQEKYPEPAQREWLDALRTVSANVGLERPAVPEVYVWKPKDLESGEITRTLL